MYIRNFEEKYLKYKFKYFKLKNQLGGNTPEEEYDNFIKSDKAKILFNKLNTNYLLLLDVDIDQMKEALNSEHYSPPIHPNRVAHILKIILSRIIPEHTYTKIIPEEIKSDVINYLQVVVDLVPKCNENSICYFIKNVLIRVITKQSKILIFCHTKNVTGDIENISNHWLSGLITELGKKLNIIGTPIIHTVDTNNTAIEKPTFNEDGFSDKFINEHIKEYDLVFIPDCGGEWYTLQNKYQNIKRDDGSNFIKLLSCEEINCNLSKLIDIILNTVKLVKPGGLILFSKFLYEEKCIVKGKNFDKFSLAILYFLNEHGLNPEIIKNLQYGIDYIIANK